MRNSVKGRVKERGCEACIESIGCEACIESIDPEIKA